jgi:hypothetical protein
MMINLLNWINGGDAHVLSPQTPPFSLGCMFPLSLALKARWSHIVSLDGTSDAASRDITVADEKPSSVAFFVELWIAKSFQCEGQLQGLLLNTVHFQRDICNGGHSSSGCGIFGQSFNEV